MEESRTIDLEQYLVILNRWKYLIIFSTLAGLIGGYVVLKNTPKMYSSEILILVEPPKVTGDVGGNPWGSTENRLQLIRQQIMSRSLLEPVLKEFGLYGGSFESSLEQFRSKLLVSTALSATGKERNIISFTIGFQHRNPQTAMEVVNRLAAIFMERNEAVRRERIEGTSAFLDSELTRLRDVLERQEGVIADFRTRYMGELPDQLGNNLGALQRYREELKAADEELRASLERKASWERLIAQGKVRDTLSGRLQELRRTLAQLSASFKDTYPDVQLLRREIAVIEERIKVHGPNAPFNLEVIAAAATESIDGGIDGRIEELKIVIETLRTRKATLERRIADFQARVDVAPQREQELIVLLRDYENLKANYQALLDRKLNATLATNLEEGAMGETFRVLDPAYLPTTPISPIPEKIIGAGVAVGLACGLGIILLFEMNDTTCRRVEDVAAIAGVPVLAMIPDLTRETKTAGRRRMAYAGESKEQASKGSAPEGEA